jgi:hypothetical protein
LAAGVARSDGLLEAAIGYNLNKPKGQLTKADLAKVTYLMLHGNKTTDATLRELARYQAMLPRLTHLQVWPNVQFHYNITDAGLREIAKMQKLTRLELVHTDTTSSCIRDLAKMQQLKSLSISSTKLSYSLPKTAQFFDDWGALKGRRCPGAESAANPTK